MYDEFLGGSGGVHADVDLGVHDINALIGCGVESGLESLLVWYNARCSWSHLAGKMGLVSDTVNLDAIGLDELDNVLGSGSLLVIVFKVVVIVYSSRK